MGDDRDEKIARPDPKRTQEQSDEACQQGVSFGDPMHQTEESAGQEQARPCPKQIGHFSLNDRSKKHLLPHTRKQRKTKQLEHGTLAEQGTNRSVEEFTYGLKGFIMGANDTMKQAEHGDRPNQTPQDGGTCPFPASPGRLVQEMSQRDGQNDQKPFNQASDPKNMVVGFHMRESCFRPAHITG